MIGRFIDVFPVALTVFIVVVLVLQSLVYVSAVIELRRIRQRDRHQLWRRTLSSPLSPRISVLMPAYGEELTITSSTASILALTYPNLEVVVINDGSDRRHPRAPHRSLPAGHPCTRCTATSSRRPTSRGSTGREREPRLVVVDKVNGGKADALNVGLNVASGELVCAIDADTLVAPDALQQLVAPFVSDPDTVAAGGTIRLTNDSVVRGGRIERVGRAAQLDRRRPGRGVHAGVPRRTAGMEPTRGEPHHQWCVRVVPPFRAARHRRLRARVGGRGHGARRAGSAPPLRDRATGEGGLQSRPGGVDRVPRVASHARTAAKPLVQGAPGRAQPPSPHDLQPSVRNRRHVGDALLPVRRGPGAHRGGSR